MPAPTDEEFWIAAEGGRLYVKHWYPAAENAADAPIVLFHDSLGCVALWRDFPAQLAEATGRGVIAYDRLGFGQSDPHPGHLDAGFVDEEARHGFRFLREALRLDRFVAFGHSVGGGMAVACAAAWPEDCVALITESAQAFVEDRTLQGIREAKQSFAQPGQLDRLRKYHGDKAAWVLQAWTETWLAPDFADWSLDRALRQVTCPVLAIHGDRDEFGSPRHPGRIASLAAGPVAKHVWEGYGHVPHRENAAAVTALVAAWLQANGGG
ncbi:alpha/beta hydrolase [Dyella sp. LX-66]|uniref:alpha/beta fold hydrolase n=1 Tax=unclassified Dyella TaxID=2634549 RepID=UPI001BE0A1B8|nr:MULTISPECIES: alpha/beta hydrolase [unclassified Dyella]MBT2118026.1 alpha/beta hydrolase [Dyella sp. LX-1]MBT2140933.1 alpha/beta hydrolase [Dyella sp. LX-66]